MENRDYNTYPYFPCDSMEDKIEDKYKFNSTHLTNYTRSMYDHFPVLRKYAEKCDHVTEFGTWAGEGSLIAFMAAKPKKIVVYDIDPKEIFFLNQKIGIEAGIDIQFFKKDTTTLQQIEETDLLFIDSFHTYKAIKADLRQAKYTRKWIICHDTFGAEVHGQSPGSRGIWPAIEEFLVENKNVWKIIERYDNCYGLTIIERVGT